MKKTFVMMVVMLSIVTTNMVAAQSKFAISNLPISVIESGSADNKIVNISGMTGNQVKNLLDAWCKERAGITLHQLVTEGSKTPITVSHGNCESLPSGLHSYYDNTPTGEVWMWNGSALVKDECCNLVASSDGVIANFLKSYFSQNQGQGSGTVINPGNGQLGQQKDNNNKMDVNVNLKGLESVAQQTNADMPWWGWIIIALIVMGGIVAAMLLSPRSRFFSGMRDYQNLRNEIVTESHAETERNMQWAHRVTNMGNNNQAPQGGGH